MTKFTVYKVFGILTFLFGLGIAFTLYIGRQRLAFDAESNLSMVVFFAFDIIIGIGLMYSRKWAAIVFFIATLSAGLWLITGSMIYTPFPYMLFNFVLASPLLMMSLIAISCRDQLKRKKKLP